MSKQYLDLTGLATFKGLMTDYVDDSIEALDASGISIASVDEGVVTLKAGLAEADGIISNTSDSDIVLAKVATTGAAADVSYSATIGSTAVTNVDDALDALAAASEGGVASKTVYITETAGTSQSAYSKRYGIYQGSTGSTASPVAGEKLVDIDIPKDMVVESGSVVDITFSENKLWDGSTDVTEVIKGVGGTATSADAGKYIKLIIANAATDTLYIKATDLVDIYTAQQNATQVQLTIDSSNVISATIVAGSIGTTELANDAVTGDKIADDAVGAEHINIAAHTEAQTAGADGVAISVTTTDGQVSAVSASIAAETYEPYGTVTTEIAKLDAEKSQTAGTDGLALSITEVDGKITSISGSIAAETYEPYGAADAAIADLDATVSQTAGVDGLALSVTEVDGVITAVSGSIAANTYDAYGSAAAAQTAAEGYTDTAIAGLDASVSQTAGTDGLALSVTEVDGKVTAVSGSIATNTYDAYGTASSAIAALDATATQSAGADGLALSVTEVDGVITAVSGSIAANTYEPYGIGSIDDSDIEALFA